MVYAVAPPNAACSGVRSSATASDAARRPASAWLCLEIQRRSETLAEGDRGRLRIGDAGAAGLTALPGENLLYAAPQDFTIRHMVNAAGDSRDWGSDEAVRHMRELVGEYGWRDMVFAIWAYQRSSSR